MISNGQKKQTIGLPPAAKRRVSSTDLLKNRDRLVIEHKGQEYTLRVTRNDKLILTK